MHQGGTFRAGWILWAGSRWRLSQRRMEPSMEAARKVDSSCGGGEGSSVEEGPAVAIGGVEGRSSGSLMPFVIWVSVGSVVVWEGIPFSFGGVDGAGPSAGA